MSEQNLPITMRDTAFVSSTWEDSDEAFSLPGGDFHSLAGGIRRHRMTLDSTTIVTDAYVDDEGFDSAPEDEEEEEEEGDDGDDFQDEYDEILNYYDDDGDVPAEVKVPFHEGGDNDDSTCHHQQHEVGGDDSAEDESSSSDCSSEEEEEEEDDEELSDDQAEEGVDEEEEGSGEEAEDEEESDDSAEEAEEEESEEDAEVQPDEEGSVSEYETDEDSLDACRDQSDDESSCCSVPPRVLHFDESDFRHELFLPSDVSPSTESLKYEEEEDEDSEDDDDYSSDEDCVDKDQDDDRDDVPRYQQRTYIIGKNNRNSGRPRMWDGFPSSASVSSSSSSSGSSRGSGSSSSSSSKKRKKPEGSSDRRGVTFNDSVTVYPVFKTAVYTPSMVTSMYTKRDELRVNKLRNKREFAYEHHDWRNAAEEEEMEANDRGELIHPAHASEKRKCGGRAPSPRNVVQTYSSALGGYVIGGMSGSAVAHRAKRMRMYYP
jgi:hypothetical protein